VQISEKVSLRVSTGNYGTKLPLFPHAMSMPQVIFWDASHTALSLLKYGASSQPESPVSPRLSMSLPGFLERSSEFRSHSDCSYTNTKQYTNAPILGFRRIRCYRLPWINVSTFIASGVGLSPLYCGHFWPTVPAPDDRWGLLWSNWLNEDWQGKLKYSKKTTPAPLCPPQIPLDQTQDRTRPAAMGSQRLTAWAMARPWEYGRVEKIWTYERWKTG
jgi:hypothetical protein